MFIMHIVLVRQLYSPIIERWWARQAVGGTASTSSRTKIRLSVGNEFFRQNVTHSESARGPHKKPVVNFEILEAQTQKDVRIQLQQ
jgi:hypothetical protein